MSRLNIGASEFVPGRAFRIPQPQPPPPALRPVERPEQTEAPAPPPTITLNIGRPKAPSPPPPDSDPDDDSSWSSAPTPAATPVPAQAPAAVAAVAPSVSKTSSAAPSPAPASKIFSTDRAKTDAAAIVQHVHAIADHETLKDLYGDGMWIRRFVFLPGLILRSQATFEYRVHRTCRCGKEYDGW